MSFYCYVKDEHRVAWHATEYTIGCFQRPALCGEPPAGGVWKLLLSHLTAGAVACPDCAARVAAAPRPPFGGTGP